MEGNKSIKVWWEKKKKYIKEEKKGLLATGAVILGIASTFPIVAYLPKKDKSAVTSNNYTISKEYNNGNELYFEDIKDTKVIKITNEDTSNSDILFLKLQDDSSKTSQYNVVDLLDNKIDINSITDIDTVQIEILGNLSDYLIVNNNVKQLYTKDELQDLNAQIKISEMDKNKQLIK